MSWKSEKDFREWEAANGIVKGELPLTERPSGDLYRKLAREAFLAGVTSCEESQSLPLELRIVILELRVQWLLRSIAKGEDPPVFVWDDVDLLRNGPPR